MHLLFLTLLASNAYADIKRANIQLPYFQSDSYQEYFTFEQGGLIEFSVSNFKHQPAQAPENSSATDSVYFSACSFTAVKNFYAGTSPNGISYIIPDPRSKDVQFISGFCSSPSICEYSSTITESTSLSYRVPTAEPWYVIFLQCYPLSSNSTAITSANLKFEFSNPGPFFLKYLTSAARFNLYFLASFLLLWIGVFVWFVVRAMRYPKLPLLWLIMAMGFTRLSYVFVYVSWFIYIGINGKYSSNTGEQGTIGEILNRLADVLVGSSSFLLYSLLLLMSKGYCVMRKTLTPLEQRSIFAAAFGIGVAESFFSWAQSAILLVTMTISIYMYLFNTMRVHLDSFMYYVEALRRKYPNHTPQHLLMDPDTPRPWYSKLFTIKISGDRLVEPMPAVNGLKFDLNQPWDIVGPYNAKLWIMCNVQRIVTYFCAITIIIRLATLLFVFEGSAFVLVASEISLIVGWCWIAYLFKSRDVFQTVKVPNWVLGKKEE